MARPSMPDRQRRDHQVNVRFTFDEMRRIHAAADRAGLSVTDLVRRRSMRVRVVVKKSRALDALALEQVRKIGINLNQAVHVANATGEIPPELARIAAYVEDILMREVDLGGP
ncbi:plasmid mobilization protein [Arvimicrobium flavum]|uniref:plasmid mobilization protein n=1 Tax=Arvimicrobium flavum TaxID=3393320 RepID=UPI00237AC527|nr:plasmid mobilization relaxosome protein MobC [Mesorhizobium shangrilense]